METIDRQHEIALGNFEARLEFAGVLQLVDIDLDAARDRLDVDGVVVEMVPSRRVVQPADHIDTVGRQHEVAVIQIVLLGREHRDLCAGLLAWIMLCRSRLVRPQADATNGKADSSGECGDGD